MKDAFSHYLFHREARCHRCNGSLLNLSPTRNAPGQGHFRGHCFDCGVDTSYDCAEGTVEAIQRNEQIAHVANLVASDLASPGYLLAPPQPFEADALSAHEEAVAEQLVETLRGDAVLRTSLERDGFPVTLEGWRERPHILRRFARALLARGRAEKARETCDKEDPKYVLGEET